MQTTTTNLTPVQFTVARKLADAYNHLWSGVPDGTYSIEDIEKWSEQHQDPRLPGGIYAPGVEMIGSHPEVVHVTGSGRLEWRVTVCGNVTLNIYRPSDLSPARAADARTMAYASISSVEPPQECGLLVASVTILNKAADDAEDFATLSTFEIGEVAIGSSSYEKTHGEYYNGIQQIKYGWNYFSNNEQPILHDDLLFERHVYALVRPLVALLTINEAEEQYAEDVYEKHQAWRKRVIDPAIERAKALLAPLFESALPDPLQPNLRIYDPETGEEKPYQYPVTYWTRTTDWNDEITMFVCHDKEKFPVESEKTAVHAVLLLRQHPDMLLVDAVKTAILSSNYQP